jgi:hypothetical protein
LGAEETLEQDRSILGGHDRDPRNIDPRHLPSHANNYGIGRESSGEVARGDVDRSGELPIVGKKGKARIVQDSIAT